MKSSTPANKDARIVAKTNPIRHILGNSMYHTFYNLATEPFRLSPDHRFCYKHRSYRRAKTYMTYALRRGEGFVVVTGAPGTGKSTLIEDLFANLKGKPIVRAKLVSTQLEGNDLVRMVAFAFDIAAAGLDKATLISRLTNLLVQNRRVGRRALLVVDEAQDLSPSALEELRLLTNLQQGSTPLLQIFLVGQQELRDTIRDKSMEQLHQRIIAACHLEPLEAEEARSYVEHRLVCTGWKGDPCISDAAFYIIHQFSEGVPRRINLVCSRLFLHGSVEERHRLVVADVREILQELDEENLGPLGGGLGEIESLVADIPVGLRDECTPSTQVTKTMKKQQRSVVSVQPDRGPVNNIRTLPTQPGKAPVDNTNVSGNSASAENSPAKRTAACDLYEEIDSLLHDLEKAINRANTENQLVSKNVVVGTRSEWSNFKAVPTEERKRSPSFEKAYALDDTQRPAVGRAPWHRWVRWSAISLFAAVLIAFAVYALNVIYA